MPHIRVTTDLTNFLVREIVIKHPESGVGHFFNAMLDSGCPENVMSEDVPKRMNLVVGPLGEEEVVSFTAAFGDQMVPQGKVTVTWSAADEKGSPRTRDTSFLIIPCLVCDVIFGSIWLFQERVFTFDRTLFPVLKKPLSKEEKAEVDRKMAEQRARNQEHVSAEEKAGEKEDEVKRQKRKQELKGKEGGVGPSSRS